MTPSAELQDLLATVPETTPITTETTTYEVDGQSYEAFTARPRGDGPFPAVLIFSDWNGIGDHGRVRAQMMARLGYIAMAGDIFGDGLQPENPSAEAGKYYGDTALFRERVTANLGRLRSDPSVDRSRIAAMGYCFGGSGALELARSGADIAAVVSFHGGLQTNLPAHPGAVTARVLVLTGTADPVVPDEAIVAFENEMREAGTADWQIHLYSGAMHAFTIPGTNAPDYGAQYDARANARSWVAMRAFLEEAFAG